MNILVISFVSVLMLTLLATIVYVGVFSHNSGGNLSSGLFLIIFMGVMLFVPVLFLVDYIAETSGYTTITSENIRKDTALEDTEIISDSKELTTSDG